MATTIVPTRRISCGLNIHCVTDISSSVVVATSSGYRFVIAPIVHPRLYREFISGKLIGKNAYFTRPDLVLITQDWNTLIIGRISPWIDLDSSIDHVRRNSEKAFDQELNYAAHLGLSAILIKPKGMNCVNMARIVSNKLQVSAGFQGMFQVYVHIPMQDPSILSEAFNKNGESSSEQDSYNTWRWWNTFRTLCGSEKRLGIALELSADLPSEDLVQRWLGEPIRCLIIPTTIFLTNKKGFPVLPRSHQSFIKEFFRYDVMYVISGANRHEHIKYYEQYMEYLWNTQPPEDAITQYARGYEDYLQIPLQPLMDNLESCTYEVFEKDPIKYTEYQNAIYHALLDRVSDKDKETKVTVVMVVGAGRGPLVQASIVAADKANRLIKVYAVEKNPNAVVTLLSHKEDIWQDKVTVVSCDMRDWDAPEKADILVSELLGSFGDNELSPECLDGAQEFLIDGGIIIPSSYTSYLSPIQSQKLYLEASQCREKDKPVFTSLETPYVVRIHNKMELAPPQPVFTFIHPKTDKTDDNTRYKKLIFEAKVESMLHGFAGYFEAVLYKDVKLSIVPETHSEGMFSWFPIYFPIREPVFIPANTNVEVHFWRCRNRKNVWYEYCVTKPVSGSIHNPNGRSYTIGL